MVAAHWQWTTGFMLSMFGAKAALAVLINALVLTLLFRGELSKCAAPQAEHTEARVPAAFVAVNLAILAAVVFTNHHPEAFMGLFLLFLGLAEAYRRHHDRLMLREGLMVAFFLAGLVVLGGQQRWWLQDILASRSIGVVLVPPRLPSPTTRRSPISARSSKAFQTSTSIRWL